MKLREITVHKEKANKLTIKGKLGGFKSDEKQGGITMTFELEDGEHLRDEQDIAKEANEKVNQALSDLMDEDPAWIKEKTGYKEAGKPSQIDYMKRMSQ